jgi:transcriptional regulator with XRE-family HTH domain
MVKLTRLKTLRERKALTQKDLSERSGVSRPTIVRLEQGFDAPYPSTVRKLAESLGVEPSDLMEAEEPARGR